MAISEADLEVVYSRLYHNFIEALDAIDNGVSQFDKTEPAQPKYSVNTDLSARVGNLNPAWNDLKPDVDVRFESAHSAQLILFSSYRLVSLSSAHSLPIL